MARRKFTLFFYCWIYRIFLVSINVLLDACFYILSKMQLFSSDPQYSCWGLSDLTQLFVLNVISDDKPSSVAIHVVYISKTRNFYIWIFNVNFFFVRYFTLFALSNYVYQSKVLKFIFFSFSSFFICISMVMNLCHHWLQQSLKVMEAALCKFNGKALTVQVRICTRQGAIYRAPRVTAYSVSKNKQKKP